MAKIQQTHLELQRPSDPQAGVTTASECLINEEVGREAADLCPRAPRAGLLGLTHPRP